MPTSKNGQTHSNNLFAVANELFECVLLFCGVGAQKVKIIFKSRLNGDKMSRGY